MANHFTQFRELIESEKYLVKNDAPSKQNHCDRLVQTWVSDWNEMLSKEIGYKYVYPKNYGPREIHGVRAQYTKARKIREKIIKNIITKGPKTELKELLARRKKIGADTSKLIEDGKRAQVIKEIKEIEEANLRGCTFSGKSLIKNRSENVKTPQAQF